MRSCLHGFAALAINEPKAADRRRDRAQQMRSPRQPCPAVQLDAYEGHLYEEREAFDLDPEPKHRAASR